MQADPVVGCVEDYGEALDVVPKKIQMCLTKILEINGQFWQKTSRIHEIVDQIASNRTEQRELLDELDQLYAESIECSQQKLDLITTGSRTIDRHLKRLDTDLQRLETLLSQRQTQREATE